jgi:hypothetical protein
VYKEGVAQGASTVTEPINRFYVIREAGFKDFHGNTWWIAHHINEVSIAELEKGFLEVRKKD